MNLKMPPSLHNPITIKIMPAIIVAIIRPLMPYWAIIPATITMNAPVGPPMRKFEPPKKLMRKPATMAVMSPCSGLTPLAIPKAIASGSAITPTITPAIKSETNVFLL